MARSHSRYQTTYARLLRLYPKRYQKRFAEPMQQMFADMCTERERRGEDTRGFVYKIYMETLAGVITEQLEEVVMHIKTTKAKVIIGITIVVVGSMVAVLVINNRPYARAIHPGTMLKQARELSKGKKQPCLAKVQAADTAVRHDDVVQTFKGTQFSNFEEAASGAIADVPAGTNYSMTINSYKDGKVAGSMTYDKDYGTYNYVIKKLPEHGQWQLVSTVACQPSH